ncbi:MAG: hypothetical protein VYB57_01060 [Cyanobacteriota bacterium]|nr:hypothetical protein [Cyanobacteriota bacterium]
MKTTIDLPDVLIQQAKQRALQQKCALKDLIADYIRQGLKGRSRGALTTQSLLVETDAMGLPLIRATSAPTVHTLPDALQLEQDLLQTHELTDLHSSDACHAD